MSPTPSVRLDSVTRFKQCVFFLTPEDYPLGVENKKGLCRILRKFASFVTFGIVTRNAMGFYVLFRVTFVGFPGTLMEFQEGW